MDDAVITLYLNKARDWVVKNGMLLLMTVLFFIIGAQIIKVILKAITRAFERSNRLSKGVESFLLSFFRIVFFAVLFIMSAGIMGFPVTSLVTLLGTSGITIGLALQGSLSNMAGGVLILILKPFDAGDYIQEKATGQEGTVTAIDIFYTHLITFDNKEIVIPNGNLSNTTVINFTKLGERKVDVKVPVSYESNLENVKRVLLYIADNGLTYILKEAGSLAYVDELGESGIVVGLRYTVKAENYFPARWETIEKIKTEFDKNNISIPYNQLDVYIKNKT